MRKFIASILLLCASTLRAQMGPVPGSGGGAVGSGTALTACTSSILYADASSLLKCNPASVVNGSVSTAGRSILTIKDTITGGSSTSNFLNITGTFNGTLSAETSGLLVSVTGDNDLQRQSSIKGIMAAAANTSSLQSAAIYGDTSGAVPSFGGLFTNSSSDSFGVGGFNSGGGTAGVGGFLGATGATSRIFGVIGSGGNASAVPAESTGVLGIADSDSGTGVAGVWARINSATLGVGSTLPTLSLRGALVADNTTAAENIFVAADNGTSVFTIADGGASTFTASTTFNSGAVIGSNFALSLGGTGYIYGLTGSTPDAPTLATSTTSESWHMTQLADAGQDFNNGACGTGACTDPAFIIHSSVVDTTQYNHLANWGQAGGALKTLTESAATPAVRIPVAALEGTGGKLYYRIKAADATDVAIREGEIKFAVVNKAGTETCTLSGASEAADGSVLAATSASTLTYAITCDTTPTNAVDLSFNAVSSLTQTTLNIQYFVTLTGVGQPARQ